MKQVLLFCIAILWVLKMEAQSNDGIALYAYTQAVSSGARTNRSIDDKGMTQPRRKPAFNTWIYITVPADTVISVEAVFIKGTKYTADVQHIHESPVLHINTNIPHQRDTTVLVSKTTHTIYAVKPIKEVVFDPTETEQLPFKENDVVIEYKKGCRTYYVFQKSMVRLNRALLP